MGILPSGAYVAKKLLLGAADGSGQWWWEIVLNGGAIFTAGYVALVLSRALRAGSRDARRAGVARRGAGRAVPRGVSFLLALANVAVLEESARAP